MIIACPKCGFEQPKIEYCANCGIDMTSFKPKKPPLKERIFRNSYFYLMLMILVLLGTGIFIKENWFPSEKRVYTFVPADYQKNLAEAESSAWNEEDDNTNIEAQPVSDTSAPREPASTAKATNTYEAPKLEMYVVALPVSSLAYIVGQEISPEDLKELRSYGVRKPLDIKDLNSLEDTSVMYNAEYMILAGQDPMILQQYLYDSVVQDEIGFKLTTSVDSYRNDQLIFVMRLTQNFYVDKTVERTDSELRVEIGEKQSRIITGILPHKILTEREKSLLQSGYLGLMNTPEFQASETTFVIVLTYKY